MCFARRAIALLATRLEISGAKLVNNESLDTPVRASTSGLQYHGQRALHDTALAITYRLSMGARHN